MQNKTAMTLLGSIASSHSVRQPWRKGVLASAVASVDREMSAIRDGGKVKARERIAVLAALNVAYQLAELNASRPASPVLHANGTSIPAEASELDLVALIQRIDNALGDDGQLL